MRKITRSLALIAAVSSLSLAACKKKAETTDTTTTSTTTTEPVVTEPAVTEAKVMGEEEKRRIFDAYSRAEQDIYKKMKQEFPKGSDYGTPAYKTRETAVRSEYYTPLFNEYGITQADLDQVIAEGRDKKWGATVPK